jgi:hypothetical protein
MKMQCMAQILEDFNTKGIFPSDEKMAEALGVKPTDSKVFDLELDLINIKDYSTGLNGSGFKGDRAF